MLVIVGERINTSRKRVNEAVEKREAAYIQEDVKSQLEAGADLIDINAGSRLNSEVDDLAWLIDIVQSTVPEVRLCIDSPNPGSIRSVLHVVERPPMLNSTTAEKDRFEAMSEIIQSTDCDIVALCIDDKGIPKNAEQALDTAARLVSDLESLGVKRERIYIDPVIQAVSTNTNAALIALEAIEGIRRKLPGANVICGLSNVSFGLPKRHLVNRAFLALAMRAGLSAAIVDPLDKKLMGTLRATTLLLGQDRWCQDYIRAFRKGWLEA